jgi:hypothetical protein
MWPLDAIARATTTHYSAREARERRGLTTKTAAAQPVTYKTYRVYPSGESWRTSLDPGSEFDSAADAKRFIDYWAKKGRPNPGTGAFQRCVEAVTAKGSAHDPKAVCATAAAGRKRAAGRRNPDETAAAAALSEQFHGRPARTVREIEELHEERETLADLGRLIGMRVWPDEDWCIDLGRVEESAPESDSFRGVRLAASPDGGQLYFVGGDQALDLKKLGLDRYLPKDHIAIGPVETIGYFTSKAFHSFEPTWYTHEFGEEGGEQPILNYDVLNRKFYLTGGSYQVRPEGIVN